MKTLIMAIAFLGMAVAVMSCIYISYHFTQFRNQWLSEQPKTSGFLQNIRKHITDGMFSTHLSPVYQYHKRQWIKGHIVILFVFLVYGLLLLLSYVLNLKWDES